MRLYLGLAAGLVLALIASALSQSAPSPVRASAGILSVPIELLVPQQQAERLLERAISRYFCAYRCPAQIRQSAPDF